MTMDLVTVQMSADVIAGVLDRHDDYRVLRRIRPMDRRLPIGAAHGGLVGVAIDVETTGLDHEQHEIIEFAAQRFRLDEHGRIVETGRPRSWLEQPSTSIQPEITRVTGLTDLDVAGRAISDGEATGMLLGSDFVVAHNASFDRNFVEKRLPLAAGMPWACSLHDVDWAGLGIEGRTLSSLLTAMGYFYDAHRAITDVVALITLLDWRLDAGGTVAGRMVEHARRPSWRVDAEDAPYAAKEVLKERGYRWDARARVWYAVVDDAGVSDEVAWASLMLYQGRREPPTRRITWKERYGTNG